MLGLKVSNAGIKVFVEVAFDGGGMRLAELVAVEGREEGLYGFEEFVNPSKLKERLVNGLDRGTLVSSLKDEDRPGESSEEHARQR